MKRIVLVVFALLFLVSGVFAQVEEKKAEIEKVKAYIRLLDHKISLAIKAKQTQKVAQLKQEKEQQVARVRRLESELARLRAAGPSPVARREAVEKKAGFLIGGGFGGGAGQIKIGYSFPVQAIDLSFIAGYGIGNGYSIVRGAAVGAFNFGDNCAGLEVGMYNYSHTVEGILGLSGKAEKGGKAGIGVFFGRKIGLVEAQVGYNTALGVVAEVGYKF